MLMAAQPEAKRRDVLVARGVKLFTERQSASSKADKSKTNRLLVLSVAPK